MKTVLPALLIALFVIGCNKASNKESMNQNDTLSKSAITYDSVLAKNLKADKYGMKKYIFAYLKKGPNRNQDSLQVEAIQKGHMANIQRLANEGKLILAGPFLDETDIRGIFIFDVETIEEAEALINTDPAIKSGRLVMELHPWYGSAALLEVNKIHKKISKENP